MQLLISASKTPLTQNNGLTLKPSLNNLCAMENLGPHFNSFTTCQLAITTLQCSYQQCKCKPKKAHDGV